MHKTLRLSFSLKNTYRVNSILYSLKQIPLLKKILPEKLYQVRGLKIFANVLSVLWEIISVFGGKLIYFLTMICGLGLLYGKLPAEQVFLHLVVFLTAIGAYWNTSLFNPSRDKYYAMILMRMNAKEYTLVNYGYSIVKVIVGFLPLCLIFGRLRGVPLWFCLLLPLCIAGMKVTVAAYSLRDYEKRGAVRNENRMEKRTWLCTGVFLAIAYGLPAVGMALPSSVSMLLLLVFLPLGAVGIRKIMAFRYYREINQELLSEMLHQMDAGQSIVKETNEKAISADTSLTSKRKGFEYLNELFIKRHQKILWKSTKRITSVCALVVCAALVLLHLFPEIKPHSNEMILTWLPYFAFIMYAINRGTGFTQALFMNCDHSLLTYSFYKQPKCILEMFRIRLRELVKVNAVPAVVIGAGLAVLLYASGGTENALNYVVLFVSILCMSVFFSIHYLTIYYLLQPYNAGTEIKSGLYRIITSATYVVCYVLMQVRMPTLLFGISCIAFCVVYSIVASILVYKFAPKTFRMRT